MPIAQSFALSQDGLLVAAPLVLEGGIAFYDVDRRMAVGRTPLPAGMRSTRDLIWIGDETLVLAGEGPDMVAVYDGRTGELRGSAPGVLEGFVARPDGPAFATLDGEEAPGNPPHVSLHPIHAPATTLVTVVLKPSNWASSVASVESLGDGAFVAWRSDDSAEAFDAQGALLELTTRPTRRGGYSLTDNARLLFPTRDEALLRGELRVTAAAGPPRRTIVASGDTDLFELDGSCTPHRSAAGALRLLVCDDQRWFDLVGAGSAGSLPHPVDFRDGRWGMDEPVVVTQRGTRSLARCGDLPPGQLGSDSAPTADADLDPRQSLYEVDPDDRVVSADGARAGAALWRRSNERMRTHLAPPGEARSAIQALSPNGELVVTYRVGETTLDVWRANDGVHLQTLDQGTAVTTLAFHPSGRLLVAGLERRWMGEGAARHAGPPKRGVKIWDPASGTSTQTLPGASFALGAGDSRLIITSLGDAAVYDWSSLKRIARWPGRFVAAQVSPSGRIAVLREIDELAGQPGSIHAVAIHFYDLSSGHRRFVVPTMDVGVAFDSMERKVAIAPVEPLAYPWPRRAHAIDLYDAHTGARVSHLPLSVPGQRPFFARADAVVGYQTAGGVRLLQLSNDRTLDVRGSAHDDHCDVFAYGSSGFEGEAHGALGYRMGDDLRRSAVVISGSAFEAQRRPRLVASFLGSP